MGYSMEKRYTHKDNNDNRGVSGVMVERSLSMREVPGSQPDDV